MRASVSVSVPCLCLCLQGRGRAYQGQGAYGDFLGVEPPPRLAGGAILASTHLFHTDSL